MLLYRISVIEELIDRYASGCSANIQHVSSILLSAVDDLQILSLIIVGTP